MVNLDGVTIEARPVPPPVPVAQSVLARAIPRGIARQISARRKRIALGIAAISDVVQWIFLPAFVEGALSPFEIALDAFTAFVILLVVGFQWRLAIALVAELVPGLDLFPTWTAVVMSLPSRAADAPALPAMRLPSA